MTTKINFNQLKGAPVNVLDFGAKGDGTDDYAAILAAWTYCLANGKDLYFPAGTYNTVTNSFPFRQSGTPDTLLDCLNISIICDGPATIFKTASVIGADVLQLNGLKNFHVRGFPMLQATISGTTAGSNGVSITNGWDNITLEIFCLNLPSLDKTTYVDGGKALTVQSGTTVNACGTLVATVYANGCAEGFGFEPDLDNAATKTSVMNINLIAENCYIAAKSVAAAASAALSPGISSGLYVRGQSVNCQQDLILNRAHGGSVELNVVTTKTAAARRLDSNGVAWRATDTEVSAMSVAYAKNFQVKLTGDKGACDTKASIGGTDPGSSTLNGTTQYCDFYLDIAGTGATSDFSATTYAGTVNMTDSRLIITAVTASVIPVEFLVLTNINLIDGILGLTSGTYTGTTVGYNPEQSDLSIKWNMSNNLVTLYLPAVTGTSNAVTFTISGAPTTIRPIAARAMSLVRVQDNTGSFVVGAAVMQTNGQITLYSTVGEASWTASGTKGIKEQTVSYFM